MDREFGVSRCKLVYIERMNKVILYSTGNYSQYPGINHNEKEYVYIGFPGVSDGKESACNAGDLGSIPESGRSLGEGNGYPHWYSYPEDSMDRGVWWGYS